MILDIYILSRIYQIRFVFEELGNVPAVDTSDMRSSHRSARHMPSRGSFFEKMVKKYNVAKNAGEFD